MTWSTVGGVAAALRAATTDHARLARMSLIPAAAVCSAVARLYFWTQGVLLSPSPV
jgi:hypothetical protein